MATERAQRPAEPPVGLSIEGVSHAFGARRVVRKVDIELPAGEVHCLVGPSGCGKTTILRLVAGLEPLQGGRIVIAGEVVAGDGPALPPERRRVGLMFQDFALFPHLRVIDNVAFGLRHLAAAERRRRARELLTQVDMAGHALSYPHMLSGGEQQRVALARALAPHPRLMLLDEPFSSLDAHLRAQVRDDCLALLRGSGTPVLMVTHDAEEAVRVGDRIHVMHDGGILQCGAPAELYAHPANPFVAEFFGPLNRFKGWVLDGAASTPLGPVRAAGLPDGAPVDILIRPEALRLVRRPPDSDRPPFTVRRVRDRGINRILDLAAADGPMVTVRITASADFRPGEVVVVEVDAAQAYVYPGRGAARSG